MCWNSKKHQKVRIARRNIKVLKVVQQKPNNCTEFFPYYYEGNCSYVLNEESPFVHIKLEDLSQPKRHYCYKINTGYHSYKRSLQYMIVLNVGIFIDNRHFFPRRYETYEVCIMECIIPKGTMYYLNEDGEYVSEKIKPIKVIYY